MSAPKETSIGPDDVDHEVPLETLLDRAKRELGLGLSALRRRNLTPREKIEAWRQEAARGQATRAFVNGDFWRKHLEPLLRAESTIRPHSSGQKITLEEATTEYLWKSGAATVAGLIEVRMREWISTGEKATEMLRLEDEKKNGVDRKGVS